MPGTGKIQATRAKNLELSTSARIVCIIKKMNIAELIKPAINPEAAPVTSESERLDIRDRESDMPTLAMPVATSIIKTSGQTHAIMDAKKPIRTPGIILTNTAHLRSAFKYSIDLRTTIVWYDGN